MAAALERDSLMKFVCTTFVIKTNRQRQADRRTGRQADRQTGRQAGRQADRQTA